MSWLTVPMPEDRHVSRYTVSSIIGEHGDCDVVDVRADGPDARLQRGPAVSWPSIGDVSPADAAAFAAAVAVAAGVASTLSAETTEA